MWQKSFTNLSQNFEKWCRLKEWQQNTYQKDIVQSLEKEIENWLKTLKSWFRKPNYKYFAIIGPVGCGKSALIEACQFSKMELPLVTMHYYELNEKIQQKRENFQVQKNTLYNIDELMLQDSTDIILFYDFLKEVKRQRSYVIVTGNIPIPAYCEQAFNKSQAQELKEFVQKNFIEYVIPAQGTSDYRQTSSYIAKGKNYLHIDCEKELKDSIGPRQIAEFVKKSNGIAILNLKQFNQENDDVAMRFRMLVDFCYFYQKPIYYEQDALDLTALFQFKTGKYERTLSRLKEIGQKL